MAWYRFHQNNSGGSFDFDPRTGISVNVYIEAPSYVHANERAEDIGLYFDGVREGLDCSCCGDRWTEQEGDMDTDEDDRVKDSEVPEPNAVFRNPSGYVKWMGQGFPETFVHPRGKPFYSAHSYDLKSV